LPEKISVIIPVFNEAKRLRRCVTEVKRASRNLGIYFEVVISEDGSTDGTDKIACELANKDSAVKHLHSDVRLGRGKAIQRAFEMVDGDIVIYVDVDLSTDLQHLIDLIKAIEDGADIATGSRLLTGSIVRRSLQREMTSRIYNWMVRWIFKSAIHDHQCGFKAFKKVTVTALLDKVKDKHWFWDTEIIIRALRNRCNVVEIPITWVQSEETKVHLVLDIKYMAMSTLKLWWQLRKERKQPRGWPE
jgi:glycosyltransferase involved in cell wall biosynthesis